MWKTKIKKMERNRKYFMHECIFDSKPFQISNGGKINENISIDPEEYVFSECYDKINVEVESLEGGLYSLKFINGDSYLVEMGNPLSDYLVKISGFSEEEKKLR